MNLNEIFVLNAKNGILLVNSNNAEMLAVKKLDIRDVLDKLQNDVMEKSLIQFLDVLTEEKFNNAKIENGKGIGIIPSLKCNFNCEYCFQKDFPRVDMNPDMIGCVKRFVYEWDSKMKCETSLDNIGLMGGEILRDEIREINDRIVKEFGKVNYSITTNGVGILNYRDFFVEYQPKTTVSLDGTSEMHRKKRISNIPNSYQKIVEGINFLIQNGIETNIATVFNPEFEVEEYSDFFDLLEGLGWLKNRNITVTVGLEMEKGIRGTQLDKWKRSIDKYKELLKADWRTGYLITDLLPGSKNMERVLIDKLNTGKVDSFYCSANIMDNLIFAPDGYVYNCNLSLSNNRIGQFFPNIVIYEDVIELYKNRKPELLKKCKKCKMKLFCKGGCPISSLSQDNTIMVGYCGLWKDEDLLNNIELNIDTEKLFRMANTYER